MIENAENIIPSVELPQVPQPVRFDRAFTPEIDKYIQIYKKQQKIPSVEGFARRIGTDVDSLWSWATKKRKNDKGELVDELARPNFYAALKNLEETERIETEKKEKKLTPKQELFCQLYSTSRDFFGNGVQSYIEAYDIDTNKPGAYHSARSSAYEHLTNPDILEKIRELLELGPLNDTTVDKELAFVISQNADLSSKVAAIREYNKVHERIIEKIDHTSKGEKISQVIGFKYVKPDEVDAPDNTNNKTN